MFVDCARDSRRLPAAPDLCIIGAGPAGLSIAAQCLGRRKAVVVLESGQLDFDAEAQLLNLGWARGPLLDRHPLYLSRSRLRMFGGSQNAWGGWCTPLLDLDLARRDWVPHSGWPISMADLSPYLARAGEICGLSPSAAGPHTEQCVLGEEIVARRYVFAPRARTVGAVYEERLRAARNIAVCFGATVTGLECDGPKRRVVAIRARTSDGTALTLSARDVVLAAGGTENARLLLANGLGNELVGRFFMEHPHVLAGSARLPGRSRFSRYFEHMDGALDQRAMLTFGLPARIQREQRLLNATVQLWPTTSDDGEDLAVGLVVRAEQAPNPDSRVDLAEEMDPFEMPVAKLDWRLTAFDWQSVCATARIVSSALESHAGARVDLDGIDGAPWPDFPTNADHYSPWGCHHIGTTRMSIDPGAGVVDADTLVHGMTNLFVAGSSIFPTSGYANPTLTLLALALRTAEYIERRG